MWIFTEIKVDINTSNMSSTVKCGFQEEELPQDKMKSLCLQFIEYLKMGIQN